MTHKRHRLRKDTGHMSIRQSEKGGYRAQMITSLTYLLVGIINIVTGKTALGIIFMILCAEHMTLALIWRKKILEKDNTDNTENKEQ